MRLQSSASIILSCLLLLAGSQLGAQGIVKKQDEVVWRDQDLVIIPRNPTLTAGPAELQAKTGEKRSLPALPRKASQGKDFGKSYSMGVQVAEGKIYYLHAQILENPPQTPGKIDRKLQIEVFHFDEPTWAWGSKPTGTLTWSAGMTPFLLREDLILGVATSPKSFSKDGRSHLFATFQKSEGGIFSVDSYPGTGLPKSVFTPDSAWRYPSLANLWLAHKTARTPSHFLLAAGSGTCWLFDVRKGSMRSMVQLFGGVNEEKMLSGEIWNGALMGVQPKPDGDFLVSALDEYAITQGWHLDRIDYLPTSASPQERYEGLQRVLGSIIRLNPRVDWYVLDHEEKHFRLEVPPIGLPETIRTVEEFQRFDWVFKPDGNLAFSGAMQALPEGKAAGGLERKRNGSKR
jgi:hypothetical protein